MQGGRGKGGRRKLKGEKGEMEEEDEEELVYNFIILQCKYSLPLLQTHII